MSDTYIVKASDIDAMDGLNKTHFLNDNAKRVNKSLGDLTGLTGFGFHIVEVEPGHVTTEHHVHYHEDECVYVLAGTGNAIIGEDSFPIGPGDFIGYRKGGQAHSIEVTGSETFRAIVVGQRLEHDVGDYTRLGKRIYRQIGLPWNLVDIADIDEPQGGKK
ncbi:cupin domain-containing protein [Pseudoprimorskyibacter insulae]|uniref:Cupin type-2 domain-containing protein n=1 Tax=Pseudoprimorskyibacter insulae TaxID=1695997 RepID=A0A2R8ANH6_9RHOB|nr:cupin domain-containing protein [Pseudoprimorskyibacter insulae]SPF77585.1 hypothetical protein PRI8871_00168 [Pseudoprimorskyibacter insulae]